MTTELLIVCSKIKDRIKEQKLAEKRGWCNGVYGKNQGNYYVHYYKKKRLRKKTK